jgi:polar amino acid transport system permease protein
MSYVGQDAVTASPGDVGRDPPAVPNAPIQAVPLRRRGRYVSIGAVVLLAAWAVSAAVRSRFLDVDEVRRFLFDPIILQGVEATVVVTVLAQVIGTVLGVLLATMRLSKSAVWRWISGTYIWFFRGTPVLVQMIFWFSALPAIFKTVSLSLPLVGLDLFSRPTPEVMTPFVAALLGLALYEGALMGEVVRGGIQSVDPGQRLAAQACGMTAGQTMRRVVLPQAMRVIIPPTGNQFIDLLKTSSIATVVTYGELLRRASDIYSSNLLVVELLTVATVWYLALTSIASLGQSYLERRFAIPPASATARRRGLRLRLNMLRSSS